MPERRRWIIYCAAHDAAQYAFPLKTDAFQRLLFRSQHGQLQRAEADAAFRRPGEKCIFAKMFEFGPDGPWLDQLALTELPPPPAGARIWPVGPGLIVRADLHDGRTAHGQPIAWARCGRGWACLLIWASMRRNVLGIRRHARWGWYVYDPGYLRAEPDPYADSPGDSYGARFLPGFEVTLAEARAALRGEP